MADETRLKLINEIEVEERLPLDNIELVNSSAPPLKIALSPISITTPEDSTSEDGRDNPSKFASASDFQIFTRQISSQVPLHRLVAIKRMVKSCKLWDQDAVLSALPTIKQLSTDKEMVIRQATADSLGPLAKYLFDTRKQDKAHHIIINELLPLLSELLKDSLEVRHCATVSLTIIAELLTTQQIHQHIIQIFSNMAHDDNHDHKITALHILGDLAPILKADGCKRHLSELIKLSKDYSFRVKKTSVQQYGVICKQLTSADTEKHLLPVFLNLCDDSIWSVRKECAEAILDVSVAVSPAQRTKLVAIMERFLNDSSRWVRNSAYQVLGRFISSLESAQITREFLKYFTSIPLLSSVTANADCTNHCAYNFPAVVMTVGKERWTELNDTFVILCKKNINSRRTLACAMHEIAAILGAALTEEYLSESIEFFFQDVDDIRQGIIANLCKILRVFSMETRIEYTSTLWKLASEPDTNWRFRLFLSQQLGEILPLYHIQVVKQEIIPLIFQLCQDRMADVRYAAVCPIADAINILVESDESAMEENLKYITTKIETMYAGRTYSKRLLYIRIADSCFDRIDNELFDKIFLNDLLNYRHDIIFNVRYCLARFVDEHFVNSEKYKHNEMVQETIEILKNDAEDVEIKRFFMSEEEIETWLQCKYEERAKDNKIYRKQQLQTLTLKHEQQDSINTDLSSTDSSVYTSSDSEHEDDINDNLKSVSDQLSQINDNLNKIETTIEIKQDKYSESEISDKLKHLKPICEDVEAENALVIDNGSYLIKAGFGGENGPRILRHNAADMETVWNDIFENELKIHNPIKRNILFTGATMHDTTKKEKMTQLMFETFNVSGIAIVNDAILSLYAFGKLTGMSMVIGHCHTHSLPIVDGYPLKTKSDCSIRADLGGSHVTKYLNELLNNNTLQTETVRDMKHKYCFVSCADIIDMKEEESVNERQYELPDGEIIKMNTERYKCNDILFEPQLMDINVNGVGVHRLLYQSFMKCDVDLRPKLYESICLSGGVTMTSGFMERMTKEINVLLSPTDEKLVLAVPHNSNTQIAAWIGGALLCSLSTFGENWMTADQYNESGLNILQRNDPYAYR